MSRIAITIDGKKIRVSSGISVRDIVKSRNLTSQARIVLNGAIVPANSMRTVKRSDTLSISVYTPQTGNFLKEAAHETLRSKIT